MLKPFLTKWSFLFKFRLFLGAVLLVLVGLFLYLKIVPNGHITYSRNWPRGLVTGKGFIYDFKPGERIATNMEGALSSNKVDKDSLKIIAEPIYFSLFTPRAFDRAIMTVTYRDHLSPSAPIIEAGVLQDKISGFYDLHPIQNNILDQLRSGWMYLEDSGSHLILQATKNYSSATEFGRDLAAGDLKDCPSSGIISCVALYNYFLPLNYRLPDNQTLAPLIIDQPLRGAHQFYVYFQGSWRLSFNFTDINLDKAADPITVNVLFNDQIVASQMLPDENKAPTGGQPENREIILKGDSIKAGVYKVDIKVSDDIVINKLESSSDKLSFINKIWPVSGFRNLTLFTDITDLQAQTASPASLQSVNFGGHRFVLDKTYEPFYFSAGAGVKEIKFEKDDIILAGNGVFSFSRSSLFNPNFKKVDRYFVPDNKVKYVIANYKPPVLKDNLKIAQVEFDLKNAYRENDKYTFLISVPGLKISDGADDYLEIKEIKVELEGKTLWEKLFK